MKPDPSWTLRRNVPGWIHVPSLEVFMSSVMSETDDFQRRADECLARADDPGISEQQRQLLIEMAMTWKQLAQEAAKVLGERESQ